MDHLDEAALDTLLAGEAGPEIRAHLDRCARCRAEAEALRDVVRGFRPPPQIVPGEIDRRVLALAARRLGRPRWRIARWAAAAVLLVAVLAAILLAPRHRPAGDVDGSGRVDIVDAYLLALRIEMGGAADRYDLNGDGRVDEADVDALARRSVALGGSR